MPLFPSSRAPQAFGPAASGTRPSVVRSPIMMVQALNNPISFLSATRSKAPGPGPGPGEGEGVGPGFPRPLSVWQAMSLSRRVPTPCAALSVRPAASQSVSPSDCRCASRSQPGQRSQAGACAGAGPGLRAPGRQGPERDGRRAGWQPPPPPSLKGTFPAPPVPSPGLGEKETWGRPGKNFPAE